MAGSWMIYGANGYTGLLTAELAVARGQRPVLAGRNRATIEALATRLGLHYKIFSLNDPEEVRLGLDGIDAVIHMAGPFSATSAPMVDACLATGTHYMDITGEIGVFEAVFAKDAAAKAAGVCLIPGTGFDVVPTDCLAAMLKEQLPDATQLELGISAVGKLSPGTTKTMLEGIPRGGCVRVDGRLQTVPVAWKSKEIPFVNGTKTATSMPWGDVSTAYHTTGIPNITVYMVLPKGSSGFLKTMYGIRALAKTKSIQNILKWIVGKTVVGPDDDFRASGHSDIWGRVTNERGDWVEGALVTPEGYSLTADASLCAVTTLLQGPIRPGAYTPARYFGSDFVKNLAGVEVRPPTRSETANQPVRNPS